jgi:DNA-binding IscR family transcriptional regulator
MNRDSKLSGVLHVLLHLADADGPVKSETMATMMHTNPVVIRRILAGLRNQGLVQSEKGHGGGWRLSCDLSTVTLHDIYVAVGAPPMLALGNRTESPGCLVEQAVNTAMNHAFHDAEAVLLARFRDVTLAELRSNVHQRVPSRAVGRDHTTLGG